jgi:hypothetical protein
MQPALDALGVARLKESEGQMAAEILLSPAEAASAAAIQQAIDALGPDGGRIVLPAMDRVLDRGLELRSNVELVGQGRDTLLRKAPGRIYPLGGYHNYGMFDVPLEHTEGLEPGMTVAVRDRTHGGFFETFARITWIDDNWAGLDCGLHSDYHADQEPVLVTAFPLIYGLNVHNVSLRDLTLDGNREQQPAGIGACRGAAVYFIESCNLAVSNVHERGFAGEGLGFQICRDVRIQNCRFVENAGNGYHPGAGSTAARFDECVADDNDRAGFFFCVRANHITVDRCTFQRNTDCGISIGTRDCYNRIVDCRVADNGGPGILVRNAARPVEVHSCRVSGCRIAGNARDTGRAQVDVLGDAHDLILEHNEIVGIPGQSQAGVYLAPSTEHIWLDENVISGGSPAVIGETIRPAIKPSFDCGMDAVTEHHYRHLPR